MSEHETERLAGLIAALPPAPEGWVRAAQELPAARMGLDEIVGRAIADAEFLALLVADLETAIAEAGYEPHPMLVQSVRARLSDL